MSIFGKSREASTEDLENIKILLATCPISVFQELNKDLNTRGFQISIEVLGEESRGAVIV